MPLHSLGMDERKRHDIYLKLLFVLALFLVFFLVGDNGRANASQTASASVQSELRLTILPALEATTISRQVSSSPTRTETSLQIGMRANTAWQLSYSVLSNTASSPLCQAIGEIGERNRDNDMQFFSISCQQDISWGDDPDNSAFQIAYQITPALR